MHTNKCGSQPFSEKFLFSSDGDYYRKPQMIVIQRTTNYKCPVSIEISET